MWAALTEQFTPLNLLIGFLLGFVALFIARPVLGRTRYFSRVPQVIGFALFFLKELVLANLRVAADVLSPRPRMRPGVIALPLDAKTDLEITLLANLITLTPGTMSLDVSADRKVLFLHAMFLHDPERFRREIKDGMERRLLEVLR